MEFEWMPVKKRPRKPRKIEREWTPSDVKMLIQLVEQRELLWDSSRANHKDAKMREKSFRVIAEALDRSLADCKAKWDNLRAQYRGYQSKASQNMSIKWQYFESLGFLNSVCEPRKYKVNMNPPNSAVSNDPSMFKAAFAQHHSHPQFMDDLNTCSSFFSASSRRRPRKEEDDTQSEDSMLAKARIAQEQIHTSAQIFGDFVADQMRALKPHIAADLKQNILKLVLEALDQNKK